MTADDSTSAAAELAEQILDAISSPIQNWRRVAALARDLVELAEAAARRDGPAPPPEET